jgi:hypothetical protein
MEIETKTTTERTERENTSDGTSSFVIAALIGVLLFLACNEHGRRAHFAAHPSGHITLPIRR